MTVKVTDISFGPTFVATEDQGRNNRIFYPRQVQLDMFSVGLIFGALAERDTFNHWLWGYVHFASSPVYKTSTPMRVTVAARSFDFVGIPVQGWSYRRAPVALDDVAWPETLLFDGASPVDGTVWLGQASWFVGPQAAQEGQVQLSYPNQFYGPGNPGGGSPSAEARLYDIPTGPGKPPGAVQRTTQGHHHKAHKSSPGGRTKVLPFSIPAPLPAPFNLDGNATTIGPVNVTHFSP